MRCEVINSAITRFILKSEAKMNENEEITLWCWQISAGDRRKNKKIVESSRNWIAESQDLIDEMWEALTKLESEPVDNAWLELRAVGQSRIFCYEHVELKEETEDPQIIMPDGKRVAVGENYSNAVMATQLVRTNDQLLNLSMGLARMNSQLTAKQMDTAVAYTELDTETRIRAELEGQNKMAEAIQAVAPALTAAIMKWMAQGGQGEVSDLPPEPEPDIYTEPQEEPPDVAEGDLTVSDREVDDLLDRFEWICKFQPEMLTESRVARVVTAFSASP